MLLKRLYEPLLAQASYLIGCTRTGEAIVVDPNRDVARYAAAAEAEGLRITQVVETHIHADFVSGSRELARSAGARLLLSDAGDARWKYAYAAGEGAALLGEGDAIAVGDLRLDVLHTPGHTPEHLSFLVTDTAATDRPVGMLTGDFLFVADVGRPDLLERAAGLAGTMEADARTLFASLQRLRDFPDYLQLWPGHGAGSACGKALGAMPQSTLGYERLTNWAFAISEETEFVSAVLAGQPEPPRYFAEMKRINREGPRLLDGGPHPPRLPAPALPPALDRGAFVVDARPAADFARGGIPGTVNIPRNAAFTTWAGWLVPYDRDFLLILAREDLHHAERLVRDLAMIGLDRTAGYFGPDALEGWSGSGRPLEAGRRMAVEELAPRLTSGEATVIDVRGPAEWEAGHIPGAPNVPLGTLAERAGELPRDRPLVLHCQGGTRSAIATSLLRALGFRNVVDLPAGFVGWERAGGPVERGPGGAGAAD